MYNAKRYFTILSALLIIFSVLCFFLLAILLKNAMNYNESLEATIAAAGVEDTNFVESVKSTCLEMVLGLSLFFSAYGVIPFWVFNEGVLWIVYAIYRGIESKAFQTNVQSEVNKKTENSLTTEEAIDYVQQHQQQFGKEEADRITESIAEISTRNQKIRWIRICVPVILAAIGAVAHIKTYFIESPEEQ